MSSQPLNTAVAFFAFNRPEPTRLVFEAIRKAQPQKLFIFLDGAREGNTTDAERAPAVRDYIESRIDWPCEVVRDYASQNLGCGKRVSSGLDSLFSQADRAIILEDDCLPDPSFFPFCETLLDRYADDESVMQIAGSNLIRTMPQLDQSYFASRHGPIWGWASWSRAWRHYDFAMKSFASDDARGRIASLIPSKVERHIRMRHFTDCYQGKIDTWDFQWLYAKLLHGGQTLIPQRNLVENIGFNAEATHTTDPDRSFEIPASSIGFPLKHPISLETNPLLDKLYFEQVFLRHTSLAHKVLMTLKETLAPTHRKRPSTL